MDHIGRVKLKEIAPLLKNRHFLKLWLAQIMGQTGINMLHFVLIIQVFEKTGNNFLVGILIAVLSLPAVFLAPIAGVIADSFNRKYILLVINVVRLAVTFVVFFVLHLPATLYILGFIITAVSQFFVPTENSSIPELIEESQVFQANSFFTISLYSTFLIGYTLAGPFLEFFGEAVSLVTIAIMFLMAAVLNAFLPNLKKHLIGDRRSVRQKLKIKAVWHKLREGLHYIKGDKKLLAVIMQVAFIYSIERAVIALSPSLARAVLGFNLAEISFFLITPLGVGTVIGALVANRLKVAWPKHKIILIGILLDAIVLLLLPLFDNITNIINFVYATSASHDVVLRIYVTVLAIISGLADVFVIIPANTFIHENVESVKRGRVFASMYALMNSVGVVLMLLFGWLASFINLKIIFSLFALATILVYFKARDHFRRFHQGWG
jgi:MFS family permease